MQLATRLNFIYAPSFPAVNTWSFPGSHQKVSKRALVAYRVKKPDKISRHRCPMQMENGALRVRMALHCML